MLYALGEEGEKKKATPGSKGQCPNCHKELIPKCGRIVCWHWSHHSRRDCDPWWEPESEWHLGWKNLVQPEYCEVVMGPHRADICSPTGLVVELQHSSLSSEVIEKRESFYRGRLLWVFDAREFVHNVYFRERRGYHSFQWMWPRTSMQQISRPLFWDMKDNSMFHVRKIHQGARCAGWGQMLSKAEFLERYLYRALTTETLEELDKGRYERVESSDSRAEGHQGHSL